MWNPALGNPEFECRGPPRDGRQILQATQTILFFRGCLYLEESRTEGAREWSARKPPLVLNAPRFLRRAGNEPVGDPQKKQPREYRKLASPPTRGCPGVNQSRTTPARLPTHPDFWRQAVPGSRLNHQTGRS